ncbi:MAG TPA: Nif3-like dinuclear metal center hexameric protein [Thermoleophilia bacterium]|nr:Nif3-like dinuclear metal center hexameric protein [Thermoleophilia bacterium]
MVLVRDILATIDLLAPFALAESWDHVGLQVGATSAEVTGVLVSLEVDDAALDEAARLGCELVLAHHPLIFSPLERLTQDDTVGRLALRAAREGRSVVIAHTNLDKAHGGVGDIVANMLGLEQTAPLAPTAADVLKLVGFVPADDVDLVRKAVFAVGAGVIGDYEHCSWSVEGQGTFFGAERSDPTVGRAGRDEFAPEVRLEVVFPRGMRRRVAGAYVGAHPYEEPAFDIYPVDNEIASLGLGRLGTLPEAMPLEAFAADVAAVLRLPSLRFAGDGSRSVRRVACLPGSGAEAITRGVAGVADVLVTGDVKYHEALAAMAQGLALIDAPHDLTEEEAVLRWSETLSEALAGTGVRVETHRRPAGVWQTYEAGGSATHPVSATTSESSALPAPVLAGGADRPAAKTEKLTERLVHRTDSRHSLYTDGGARGNPGPAGVGAVLLSSSGDVVDELADFIGVATNNVAEYQALIAGLELALDRDVEGLDVFLDSELVVRQLSGQYRVKDATLKALHAQATYLMHKFHEIDVKHVPREQNAAADALVNQAIDAAQE